MLNAVMAHGVRALIVTLAAGGASAAHAQLGPVRLQTGGFDIRVTAGGAVQGATFDDSPTSRNTDGNFDVFARLNAEWTSASGIIIGMNIEGNNQQRQTEALNTGEIYGFVASDYGRVEVGQQDGPADTLSFAAPVIGLGQVRGDFSRYAGSQALLRPLDTQDSFKVIYLTPPIRGFRAGVSWSPKVSQNITAVDPRSRTILRNAVEAGLQFQQPVGKWILGASGGYTFGRADPITTRAGLNSWSVGVEARRGPLRIGGAYVNRGDSNRLERGFNQREVNGGVGWITERWGAAFSGAFTEAFDRNNRLLGLGGFYAITTNFQIRVDVVQFREERVGRTPEQGVVALLELQFTI